MEVRHFELIRSIESAHFQDSKPTKDEVPMKETEKSTEVPHVAKPIAELTNEEAPKAEQAEELPKDAQKSDPMGFDALKPATMCPVEEKTAECSTIKLTEVGRDDS